jgi:two-component system, OmpR family, phosphate regulon sensor histidine kinase PhoR
MTPEKATPTTEPIRPRVLVVDDEPGIRRGCERVLRAEGYDVLCAERGEQGLEILCLHPDIDLVLVDLRMPGISGFEFLDQARRHAAETLFVVITAYATLESAVEATRRGAYDFIAKPFTPDDLLRLVNRSLERVRLIRERNHLEKERGQRMLELAAEKSRLRTVIDCMTDGVLVCNDEQRVVLHNPSALRLLRDPLPPGDSPPVDECVNIPECARMISEASLGRERLSNELKLAGAPDKEAWALVNIAPIQDAASERFLGTVMVVRDITQLKQVESVKAQFVHMVAHELRAPLSAVDGYLSALQRGYVSDPDKQQEILERSRSRIKALVDLVGDLLEMSRMESGAVRREIRPQQVAEILAEVMELMRPLAEKSRVRLEVEETPAPPSILADREELIRLFTNLVSNAVKYNRPDGSVRARAESNGSYVRVTVRDTGVGISPEGQQRLFTEFFREKTAETQLVTGTGLGLSIVKRIVDFYRGRIQVQSERDQGSTFTVELPAHFAGL